MNSAGQYLHRTLTAATFSAFTTYEVHTEQGQHSKQAPVLIFADMGGVGERFGTHVAKTPTTKLSALKQDFVPQ